MPVIPGPRRCPAVRLALAAAVTLLLLGGAAAQTSESKETVGIEVRDALALEGTARVVILLDLPDVPSRGLDRLKEEVSGIQERVLALLDPDDLRISHRFGTIPALAGEITAAGLERLARHPLVLRVDLAVRTQAHLAQSVPLIQGNQVQALGYRGAGVTVAILDTGVDTDHIDLSDDIVGQECFCSIPCCPGGESRLSGSGAAEDGDGHGTNVSGIVTSNGNVSSTGVAPDASILAVKVLSDEGSGYVDDAIAALEWIYTDAPAVKVINMSLGAGLFTGDCDSATSWTAALAVAINNLRNRGTITFASAGNDASGTQMGAPACIANAISVGAVYDANIGGVSYGPPASCTDNSTQADKVTCFSDSNSTTDIFAPGAAIRSDGRGGTVSTMYGTSQASPHAAGCAADLLGAIPSLTPAEIEATLEASGVQVISPRNGLTFPRIACLAALQNLGACIDRDSDGYGQPGSPECPNGETPDCDDIRATVYPGAPEICDGLNDNCSDAAWPAIPANEADQDGDTRPLCADCDDLHATIYPGAPQICDGLNNDCDAAGWPAVPANEIDGDSDGRLACADCDDANAAVYPGAPQVCDGLNNDCDSSGWPTLVGTNERDDDLDALSECQGDCLDINPTVYPGAPQICDGMNNDCNAPGWPAIAGTNETDDDNDTFSECQADCNDGNAAVFPAAPQVCDGVNNDCSSPGWPTLAGTNENDDDADSFNECQADCNDLLPAVFPGAPDICDGFNNDCLAPGWPALAGTNESDDDGDTFAECQADCNDTDPATYSGAPETNDGRDNQCPPNPGYGITDEISGDLVFINPVDRDEISWPDQIAATLYEAVRSDNPAFPPVCGDEITPIASWSDPVVPAAGGVFFYLVRPIGANVGSWGRRSSGAERTGLCGGESICTDGVDNDGDSQTDCDDLDCFQDPACAPATFIFADTLGNNIAPEALTNFLSGLTVASTDYILFSISGPGGFRWCSERADFYRDSYLAMAATGGTVYSGTWNRWSLLEGGSWVGPDTTGYPNSYGWDCLEPHAWCSESGLGGRYATILPEQVNECEAADFLYGCGTGSWIFSLKIGSQRISTCGF